MLNLFTGKGLGVGSLTLVGCLALAPLALSTERTDREVYNDVPDVEHPGRTIHGKVVKVVARDAATHTWDVSVQNVATGEVVQLHLDKTTERKEKEPDPALGDFVITKYDEHSKHALTFVKDTAPAPEPTKQ